jgi:hypothetical protein
LKEAACAAAASPKLFKPFEISHRARTFHFEDASFCQASNPSQLALNDLANHPVFKNREIGCFVSLGAGRPASSAQMRDKSSKALWDRLKSKSPVSRKTFFESLEKLAKDAEEVHQCLLKAPQT